MIEAVLCAVIGYALGQLNPAAFLAKIKNTDLREKGTGNLGATNTVLVFGKGYGVAVMLFDVFKSFFAIKIAKFLFVKCAFAGLIAGCFAVIGHIYPAYLHFRGGKGVASFAGMILAYDIRVLLVLLGLAILIMIVTNTGHYGPVSAMILFPLWLLIRVKNIWVFGSVMAIGGLIIYKHIDNFKNKKQGTEMTLREFSETVL